MRFSSAVALASIVGVTAIARAQVTTVTVQPQPGQQQTQPGQPGTPQRVPARPLRPGETPPKGSAVLRGQVMAAGTGAPVRRAQVRAMSNEGRGGGVTSTDNEGRYEIKDLAAGRYSITASKGGFVQSTFGQRRPNEPGTPIDLADGQTAEKVNFTLSRGSVIAGRILDDGGEPVSGTTVSAMRYQFMAGTRRLMPGGGEGSTAWTDDQGSFRLYGLPPGDYYVRANNRTNTMMMPGINNTEPEGFAPTYYPGTPNLSEASMVTVKAGQEMTGANFALIIARMARIRGRATNSSGQPVSNAMLMLSPAEPSINMPMNTMNAMVSADGSFQFVNVAPGRYNLNVRPSGMASATAEIAMLPITVGNEDLDNVIVTTAIGAIRSKPVLDASAVIFPADSQRWTPSSRYVRTLRPDTNGRYNIKALPPHEDYLIIAVQNLEAGQGSDPDFLTRAKEEAKPFSLTEGETKAVDVKLSKLVP